MANKKTGSQIKKNTAVIILAGGHGNRCGNIFKQFVWMNGRPLFFFSLEKFLKLSNVGVIILVLPPSRKEYMKKLLKKMCGDGGEKIHIVDGGSNRRESAYHGLSYLVETLQVTSEYVFFHDAARPMISLKLLKRLREEAKIYGGSTVGVPAIDLLFKVKNNFIEEAVNKATFYYGFTPQCLPLTKIWHAHVMAVKKRILHDVDNIELLKKFSKDVRVRILDEFYPNIKMTYRQDAKILRALLPHRKK